MDKTPLAVVVLVLVELAFSLMFVGNFCIALGSVLGLVVVLARFRGSSVASMRSQNSTNSITECA